jgi:hypothetical protein
VRDRVDHPDAVDETFARYCLIVSSAAFTRLFKAYVLCEQLDRLWTYKSREGVARFLFGWLKAALATAA